MGRPGIAVEKFRYILGCSPHNGVVDFTACCHRSHRLSTIGDGFCHGDQVGLHIKAVGCKRTAGATKASDDFVKHQQNAVLCAKFAKPLQIALWRHQSTGRTCNGLDKNGGDVFTTVIGNDPSQILGQINAVIAFAHDELVFRNMGVAHMDSAWQRATEGAAVIDHAGKRHAAEIHAMIGALAGNEHLPITLAPNAMVIQRHLHRGINRLRAGIDEENLIDAFWHEGRNFAGQLEAFFMAAQKAWRKIELSQLLGNGFGNFAAAMACGRGEKTR